MDKYILIPARTNSEWDGVSFALLNYSAQQLNEFLKVKNVLESLKPLADKMALYVNDVEFFTNEEELPQQYQPQHEDTAMLVELSKEQFEALSRPEQTIKYGERVYTDSGITFIARGKHTDEEYWCELHWERIEKWEVENPVVEPSK